jgi:HlyD family secretion protein
MKRCVLIAFVVVILIFCYYQLPRGLKGKVISWFVTDDAVSLTGAHLNGELIPQLIRWRGELQAVEVVDVLSPVAGQLSKFQFKVGERVAKGQILATVGSYELRGRLEKIAKALEAAKADLAQKEKQVLETEKALERARELHNRDLIAGRDLNEAETALDTAHAQQALARAQIAEHQAALEQTQYLLSVAKLIVPFTGFVTRILAKSGAYVQTATPVFSVGAVAPLKVVIEIAKKNSDFVREGAAVEIRVPMFPGRVFEGQVNVVRVTAETNQNAVAEIRLDNRDGLLAPGMMVEATLAQNSQ